MSGARTTDFGARLRRSRKAAELTQEELASKAGLTAKAISALERGERKRPHPHTVRSLADALGLPDTEREAFVASAPKRIGMAFSSATEPGDAPPLPPTPIVGRDLEVAAVLSVLEGDRVRLVTLTGPGGVGKTRLALEVVNRAADRFSDGAVFVTLAPISSPDLV
ncbi:MAG TPA: helix-turn-helix domain-containing protein, partial [Thermoanaerobaculia bacterium]